VYGWILYKLSYLLRLLPSQKLYIMCMSYVIILRTVSAAISNDFTTKPCFYWIVHLWQWCIPLGLLCSLWFGIFSLSVGFNDVNIEQASICRFQWLLPLLDPEYVSGEIVDAVLTNQAMLCLPRIINVALLLKKYVKCLCFWVWKLLLLCFV